MSRSIIGIVFSILIIVGICITTSQRVNRRNAVDNLKNTLMVDEATTQIPFDAEKWSVKDGWSYTYRDMMLDDVVTNQAFRSLSTAEIIDRLGEPTRINEGHLYYRIAQKRAVLWPLHTKTLVIKMNNQDSVEWMKIHQ